MMVGEKKLTRIGSKLKIKKVKVKNGVYMKE